MQAIFNRFAAKAALLYFIAFTFWWVNLFLKYSDVSNWGHYLFAATYGFICIWGAYRGLSHSNRWGGLKSVMGRALILLSLGLLAQEFGQLVFSYYNIFLQVEIPYPSLADVGYFGSIPLYIAGIVMVGWASGVNFSLKRLVNQIQLVAIPALMLFISYYFFLRGYEFDFSQPLKIFLDFGYPLGQAIYISLAILTFSLSRQFLGGVMRNKVFLLIVAFVTQYVADYNFLSQASSGTWVNGGYGDYLYFVAYFIMTLGLISFYDPNLGKLVFAPIVSATQDIYSKIILKIKF